MSDSEYSDMSEKEDDGCMEEGEKDNLFELLLVFVGVWISAFATRATISCLMVTSPYTASARSPYNALISAATASPFCLL